MSFNTKSVAVYPTATAVKIEEPTNTEYTFTEIIIHSSTNNNTNSSEIKGILKKPEPESGENILLCVKTVMFTILLAFTLPFIVCNLYYAYNDDSCVTINPDNFGVNLQTYLAVDGIILAVALFVIMLSAYCFVKEGPNDDHCCLYTFGKFATIFGMAWTIIGSVIFWKFIDNKRCDGPVYNYVSAQLVIKIVCYFFRIMSNINNNNNK
jgi:hypothetical protein